MSRAPIATAVLMLGLGCSQATVPVAKQGANAGGNIGGNVGGGIGGGGTTGSTSLGSSSSGESTDGGTLTAMDWPTLRGVDYRWGPLINSTSQTALAPAPSVSFPQIAGDGWRLVRAVYDWSWNETNPSTFTAALASVADAADANGLHVIYSLDGTHGLPTSWPTTVGFPASLIASGPYSSPTDFWNAWLAQTVSVQGAAGWDLQVAFLQNVLLAAVDGRASTLGYEIVAEPQVPNGQYAQLSTYQSTLASRLRALTTKWIAFMGPFQGAQIVDASTIEQCAPSIRDAQMVFDAEEFAVWSDVGTFSQVGRDLGVPTWIGSFGPCAASSCTLNLQAAGAAIVTAVKIFEDAGVAWSYASWTDGSPDATGDFQNLLDQSGTPWTLCNDLVTAN